MFACDIAHHLGLRRYARSWRGDCPNCCYAGTFSVLAKKDGSPAYFCAACGDSDAIAATVASAVGQPREPQRHGTDDATAAAARERKRTRAMALWNGSESATGTLADLYLTARGLPGLAASAALRFRGDCPHPQGARLPAMIALVTDATGTPIAIHRTFLARDGSGKASIEPTKATFASFWGGAIRLSEGTNGEPLVIGEGIESSASAGRLLRAAAWSGIAAGNLAKGVRLPPQIKDIIVAADADRHGLQAAQAAAARWRREGRHVKIAIPNETGCDFNNLLVARSTRR
jgi:phage/plasmid primase-like uncharacterized protein